MCWRAIRDRFRVVALGAHRNAAQARASRSGASSRAYAALADARRRARARRELRAGRARARACWPAPGRSTELAALPEVDCVMAAIVGAAGLRSTLAAARAGKRLLLANKESLVMAGPLLMAAVRAARRDAAADRQRAQRHLPVPAAGIAHRCDAAGRAPRAADRLRRSVPRLAARGASRRPRPSRPARIRTGSWDARSRSTRRR